jgi:hypothetical protein
LLKLFSQQDAKARKEEEDTLAIILAPLAIALFKPI